MEFQLANETVTAAVRMPILANRTVDPDFAYLRGLKELRRSRCSRYSRYCESDDRSDLELAMAVQRQMLPRNMKQLATARYAGISVAAKGVGGDYYDFLQLQPGSLGLLLADVSGKGIAAALLMANLQALIRSECLRGIEDPRVMLECVNTQFLGSTLPEQYATLFFSQYDDQKQRLEYVNCGQQPAIVVRRDGSVERLETTAMPLGVVRNWTGEKQTLGLQRGDMVCVCSDGVVEAGIATGQEFGEERLISLISDSLGLDIDFTVARILDAARLYGSNGSADDMTIIGMLCV